MAFISSVGLQPLKFRSLFMLLTQLDDVIKVSYLFNRSSLIVRQVKKDSKIQKIAQKWKIWQDCFLSLSDDTPKIPKKFKMSVDWAAQFLARKWWTKDISKPMTPYIFRSSIISKNLDSTQKLYWTCMFCEQFSVLQFCMNIFSIRSIGIVILSKIQTN